MPKRSRKTETTITQEPKRESEEPSEELAPQENIQLTEELNVPQETPMELLLSKEPINSTKELRKAFSAEENIQLIEELLETFTAKELAAVRDLAEKWRKRKVNEAKQKVLGEMKEKLSALGLSLVDVIPSKRTPQKKTQALPIKYRSPKGETWSGRGHVPIWLKQLEQAGHNREEYAVTTPVGSHMGK